MERLTFHQFRRGGAPVTNLVTSRFFLPLLSGFFVGTSYIPFPPWASLFCFVPLWIHWQRCSRLSQIVLDGWLSSFVFTLIGFNWVAYLLHEFAHLPWILAVLGLLVFAATANLFVPLAGLIWYCLSRKRGFSEPKSIGLMALITVLCEMYSLTLFDWNFGYSWYASGLPVYQWAEFIGFSGLSAVTILFNVLLYFAWWNRRSVAGWRTLGVAATGFLLLNLSGLWIQSRLENPDDELTAVIVQANIGNEEKSAAELGVGFRDEILAKQLRLTHRALNSAGRQSIDFAIWPEAAFPSLLGEGYQLEPMPLLLEKFLARRHLALITGGYGVDRPSNRITNSLFILDRDGTLIDPHYSKTHLLAFGEYIPGEQWFPQIRDWLPPIGQYARGPGPTVLLQWERFKAGPQICYESLFPGFSRGLADLGAQFIVNVTNDSWYGTWQEPHQHMYMTLARAVEFRRPVLRATNTGISTAAVASGEILQRSPLHQEWYGVFTVPYLEDPQPTFYQQYYWMMPGLLWIMLLGTLLDSKLKSF